MTADSYYNYVSAGLCQHQHKLPRNSIRICKHDSSISGSSTSPVLDWVVTYEWSNIGLWLPEFISPSNKLQIECYFKKQSLPIFHGNLMYEGASFYDDDDTIHHFPILHNFILFSYQLASWILKYIRFLQHYHCKI